MSNSVIRILPVPVSPNQYGGEHADSPEQAAGAPEWGRPRRRVSNHLQQHGHESIIIERLWQAKHPPPSVCVCGEHTGGSLRTHAYTHTRTRARTYAHTHARTHTCTRAHTHTHARTHAHTHTQRKPSACYNQIFANFCTFCCTLFNFPSQSVGHG